MKILVTGATGFIGRNLCERLLISYRGIELLKANSKTEERLLREYLKECEMVYNLAAVHRPNDPSDFKRVNVDYLDNILNYLKLNNPQCKIATMSSIQVGNGSAYGDSKLKAEQIAIQYSEQTGSRVNILRLTNCFGKYARPNGHSVVATFCFNFSHNLPIRVNDPKSIVHLCYIDDAVDVLLSYLDITESSIDYIDDRKVFHITLGYLVDCLQAIKHGDSIGYDPFMCELKKTYEWYAGL